MGGVGRAVSYFQEYQLVRRLTWGGSYGNIVENEPSNMSRWALVMSLSEAAMQERDSNLYDWCQANRTAVLRSLRQVNPQEMDWFIYLSITEGGEFLREMYVLIFFSCPAYNAYRYVSLYPQLETQHLPLTEFWVPFLQRLYENKAHIISVDTNTVDVVINHRVGGIVAELPALPRKMVNGQEQMDVQPILEAIYLCVETGQFALCAGIAQRMREAVPPGGNDPRFPLWSYYLGVTTALENYINADPQRSGLVSCLRQFFIDAVLFVLSSNGTLPDGGFVFPVGLNPPIVAMVINAAKRAGGVFFLNEL